jgi:threonylcarbamoyladenosine tRNA methylthiotransferase MtaB
MHEIITFGCRLNNYESQAIKEKLTDLSDEKLIIFNTCAVTAEAERQAVQAIRKAAKNKPDHKIIVTGCAAQINPDKYAQLSEVDRVIGNNDKFDPKAYRFQADTEKILVNDIMSIKDTASHLVTSFDGKARAFVQVQNGCNHRCTFCTIPYGRGNSRSVPIGEIVNQAKILVENGYSEIVLTGVDITDFGLDLPGKPTLGQMIKRLLNNIPKLKRIRLSSVDVAEIDMDLKELIMDEARLMPHFHLSMQSGDNMILKRMKRRHNAADIIAFCDFARSARPNCSFGADIIAGFPTETDQMFENTLNLISTLEIHFLHVFPYSAREGTPAAKMPQVPNVIRKDRAKILREQGLRNLEKFSLQQLNLQSEVIIESDDIARTDNFLQVKLGSHDLSAGSLAKISINQYSDHCLHGVVINGMVQ